jgi:hypothetical protein
MATFKGPDFNRPLVGCFRPHPCDQEARSGRERLRSFDLPATIDRNQE